LYEKYQISRNDDERVYGRDDGRDMGGIKNISPVLFPLYIKAFPEKMGEMRDFLCSHQ
jgi:hypothetical protein